MKREKILEIAKECGASIFKDGEQVVVADKGISGSATEFIYKFYNRIMQECGKGEAVAFYDASFDKPNIQFNTEENRQFYDDDELTFLYTKPPNLIAKEAECERYKKALQQIFDESHEGWEGRFGSDFIKKGGNHGL